MERYLRSASELPVGKLYLASQCAAEDFPITMSLLILESCLDRAATGARVHRDNAMLHAAPRAPSCMLHAQARLKIRR
jgi:hypothetical protein